MAVEGAPSKRLPDPPLHPGLQVEMAGVKKIAVRAVILNTKNVLLLRLRVSQLHAKDEIFLYSRVCPCEEKTFGCSCLFVHNAVAIGDNMLPLIERDFPFCHVSPSTARRLWQKQLQQVTALTRSKVREKASTVQKMTELEQKQNALIQIIKKELDHTRRMVSL